jgi:hypothetical protein
MDLFYYLLDILDQFFKTIHPQLDPEFFNDDLSE